MIERAALDPYNSTVAQLAQQKVFRLNLSNLSFNRGLWKELFDVRRLLLPIFRRHDRDFV